MVRKSKAGNAASKASATKKTVKSKKVTEAKKVTKATPPKQVKKTNEQLAQELVDSAWELKPSEKKAVAKRALALFPLCADAMTLLAGTEKTSKKKVELLRHAVGAGVETLGKPFLRKSQGTLWKHEKARPFLRAVFALSHALWEADEKEEAIDTGLALLEWNNADNQGMRYILLHWLACAENTDRLNELIELYDDNENTAFWEWGKLFAAVTFKQFVKQQFEVANQSNRYVADSLLAKKVSSTKNAEFYFPGGKTEAQLYCAEFGKFWKNSKLINQLGTLRKSVKK